MCLHLERASAVDIGRELDLPSYIISSELAKFCSAHDHGLVIPPASREDGSGHDELRDARPSRRWRLMMGTFAHLAALPPYVWGEIRRSPDPFDGSAKEEQKGMECKHE